MTKTKINSIILILFCAFIVSIAQVLLKIGSKTAAFDLSLLNNYILIIGLILYGIGALIMIIALKYGELSVLYPLIATSFIWVSLESMIFLGEKISIFKGIGILFIIIGISFIGKGAKIKK